MLGDQGSPEDVPSEPALVVCCEECWLTALQLMAVQPACLKAHQGPQLQELPDQGPLQPPAAAAPDGHPPDQYETNLLLHIQADLTNNDCVQWSWPTSTVQTVVAGSPLLPLQLTEAVLELLILGQESQVVHQAQYSMLQLVSQQQEQQSGQHSLVVQLAASTAPAARAADTALQDGPGSSAAAAAAGGGDGSGVGSAPCASEAAHDNMVTVAAEANSRLAAVQGESSSSPRSDWSLSLYLHITFQSPPSNQLVDSLHLLLTIRNVGQQQLPQQGPAAAARLQAVVLAEVPLLVLPALAQQEVQQLLLPAMRQEVQAEQQQQQEQGQEAAVTADDFARQCLLVEHIVWVHFCNLANDICLAAQLARAAKADAGVALPPPLLAAAVQGAAAEVLAAAAPLTAAVVPSPVTALEQITTSLLFPVLLPFLAAHGLHNLLQLLVAGLPEPLQQQWEQQQTTRLQHLTETAPAAHTWPVLEDTTAAEASPTTAAEITGPPAAAVGVLAGPSASTTDHGVSTAAAAAVNLQPTGTREASAEASAPAFRRRSQQQQQQQHASPQPDAQASLRGSGAATAAAGVQVAVADEQEEQEATKTSLAARSTGTAASPAVAAAFAAGRVSWATPLTQFEPAMESRYLGWKHQTLSYLDYFAALFGVMYLAVLLKRSYSEPTSLFYCLVIMIKTLPHVPLILGFNRFFFRYREFLLFMVAPVSVATFFWFTVIQQIGAPEALLPQRAISAYWSSHGELATSAMRPFTQHMRLRQYIIYCLLDAAIMVWVFGKVYGVWAASGRWGFACGLSVVLEWGLDLHMRRGFVGRGRV